ncbi:4-hydroxy-2-oxovalerate aldolase [beta proteobacterium KB13]|uniref:4-hydroxy-2-oxovalerate aldolase n=1 Tax=beta proteobacterium KB13 TaxID=314607 RepID=B6BTH8_9PROT|nr:4-hydroxy-2-oxovalerate aldolase [beta proteobacterium KB13]
MESKKILISDPTLRDGSHAIKHKFSKDDISNYCKLADKARIPIVEVGHGNGIGASSLQLGESLLSDFDMLSTARKNLKKSKLGVHVIPGFATIDKDILPAVDVGVDVFRIATHCTESDLSERHISFLRKKNLEVWGCLMMAHMVDTETLIDQAKKIENYGADGVIFMDSAGSFIPNQIKERVEGLVSELNIMVGFHGHNNLNLAVANSLEAIQSGATLVDACSAGFGAGAGNTQLEVLIPVLLKQNFDTNIDFNGLLDLAEFVISKFGKSTSSVHIDSMISGYYGVFSGFLVPVRRVALEYKISPIDIFKELGRRNIIAGQEDLIIEVANSIRDKSK